MNMLLKEKIRRKKESFEKLCPLTIYAKGVLDALTWIEKQIEKEEERKIKEIEKYYEKEPR